MLQPLIWLARRRISSNVLAGTPPLTAAVPRAVKALRASGTRKAGLVIRACMIVSFFLSHRPGFGRHACDEARRGNVTDGKPEISGRAVRGPTQPPPARCLPHAGLAG